MLEFALRTLAPHEIVEDRLFTLYQQAGLKISKDHPEESDELFEGLARSVLALDHPYREALIAGKLFGDLDVDIASVAIDEQQFPNEVQEIRSGRFSDDWSIPQVATLLKRSSVKKTAAPGPSPGPAEIHVEPLPADLQQLAVSLQETSPEQMQDLKEVSEAVMESDIIDAAVRTLVSLIPLVKSPLRRESSEKDLLYFSAVIHQLEDILAFVLKRNMYDLATKVLKALRTPVEPLFKPRVAEALKKTATKAIVKQAITDMRKHSKGSPEYAAAYDYLANLEQKATEALLELLTEEKDRGTRIFQLDLLKDFGKDQFAILNEHIADGRWYVVRNIVSILAESKSDQALALLRKAADHVNVQIRQEVIKALIAISGKKASVRSSQIPAGPGRNDPAPGHPVLP